MWDIEPFRNLHLEYESKTHFKDGTIVYFDARLNDIYQHLDEICVQILRREQNFWTCLVWEHCVNCEFFSFLSLHKTNLLESWNEWKLGNTPIPIHMFPSRGQGSSRLYAYYAGYSIPIQTPKYGKFLIQRKLDDKNLVTINDEMRIALRSLVLLHLDEFLQEQLFGKFAKEYIDQEFNNLFSFSNSLVTLHGEDSYDMTNHENLTAVVCFSQKREYVGHVYMKQNVQDILEFGGIRSTVFMKRKARLALKLLHGIGFFVHHHPIIQIVYIFLPPIGYMVTILQDFGFHDQTISKDDLTRKLLENQLDLRFVY
jgi:hypothetical protein